MSIISEQKLIKNVCVRATVVGRLTLVEEDLSGPGGIMEQLTKRLYERVLGAEMTHYLGYEGPSVQRRSRAEARKPS